MQTGRLFIALWPDEATRQALTAWQRALAWPAAARPTPAQDLHLTLLFIGSIPENRLQELANALEMPAPPIELTLDTLETWRAGLTLLTPKQVPQALTQHQAAISAAVRTLGLAFDERPYRPHVTLARRGQGAQLQHGPPSVLWPAQGHVLAMRDGAHYRVLRRYLVPKILSPASPSPGTM